MTQKMTGFSNMIKTAKNMIKPIQNMIKPI